VVDQVVPVLDSGSSGFWCSGFFVFLSDLNSLSEWVAQLENIKEIRVLAQDMHRIFKEAAADIF
jgi:hypothetical protein